VSAHHREFLPAAQGNNCITFIIINVHLLSRELTPKSEKAEPNAKYSVISRKIAEMQDILKRKRTR